MCEGVTSRMCGRSRQDHHCITPAAAARGPGYASLDISARCGVPPTHPPPQPQQTSQTQLLRTCRSRARAHEYA
eukprot:362261-Chlamydomonas_euryale.AAC.4